MTQHRDFKRVVRARAARTGESYTAARAALLKTPSPANARQVVSRADAPPAAPVSRPNAFALTPSASAVKAADYARLAGMSDEALKAKTGCGWEKWVHSLDHVNASAWPHREIARYVRETYKQPSWWSQTIAVGYERVRGLREAGQRRGGGFVVNKSRTMESGVGTLYRWVREPRERAMWLPGVKVALRSATKNKIVRFTLTEDGTSLEVRLESKGPGRGVVALQHEGIASREKAELLRAWWGEVLDELVLMLGARRGAKRRQPAG